MPPLKTIPEEITGRYIARTPKSQAMTERARRVLPGGDTRTGTFFAPYAAFMVQGKGATLTDLDGNTYLDFLNNFTSLVHGHAHPMLVAAVQSQVPEGTAYASPMVKQVELAEQICARVPSVERLRFCNSGTEATMLAVRAARAFTGRSGIVKMRGGYHGSHDLAAATADPEADRGIPEGLRRNIFFAAFNSLDDVRSILQEHASEIAGILVEPVPNAGGIPVPHAGYLQGLRDLADRYGVLLIFDEVITLRLSRGGYQEWVRVKPDLTAMGKIIGGGYPVGAFGGKQEIMEEFNPVRRNRVTHSGTFNGNNVTMAAGLASLQNLPQSEIDRINALGDRLAAGFDEAFSEAGIVGQTTHVGSLIQLHWRGGEIANMDDVAQGFRAAGDLPYLLHLEMMNRGVYAAARGEFNISTVVDTAQVEQVITEFNATLHTLKPFVADTYPALLAQ